MWSVWNGSDEIFSNKGIGEEKERIYIRGLGNSKITGGDSSSVNAHRWELNADEKIDCYGPIGTLLNYKTVTIKATVNYGLSSLFREAKKLKIPPRVDMHGVGYAVFAHMFQYSGVEQAPLVTSPYSGASFFPSDSVFVSFLGSCEELESVPDLRSQPWCNAGNTFGGLFFNCKKLSFYQATDDNDPNVFIGHILWADDRYMVGEDSFAGTSGSHRGNTSGRKGVVCKYGTTNPIIRDIYNVSKRPYLAW